MVKPDKVYFSLWSIKQDTGRLSREKPHLGRLVSQQTTICRVESLSKGRQSEILLTEFETWRFFETLETPPIFLVNQGN